MKLLPRHISNETFNYSIGIAAEDLKKQLLGIFSNQRFATDLNMTGAFKSDYEFVITDKTSFGTFIKGGGQSYASLKGVINTDNQRTFLKLTIKPNPIVPVFAIAFPLAGLYWGLPALFAQEDNTIANVIVFILFTFILPLLCGIYGQASKDKLLNRFIKHFGLNEPWK